MKAEPVRAYVLCGTPRSGSTLLCGLLRASGVAGAPDSFFRTQSRDEWTEEWRLPRGILDKGVEGARRFLEAARVEGTAGTGVFGLRLMRENLADAMAIIAAVHPGLDSDRARFDAAFGPTAYVYLSREDMLAQAISRVRAEQSGLWHAAPDGTEIERTGPPRAPRYDRAAIATRLTELARHDRDWQDWFTAEGITPLRLRYEAIAEDPRAAVAAILTQIGQDPAHAAGLNPGTRRLADQTSAEWAARFRAETGG